MFGAQGVVVGFLAVGIGIARNPRVGAVVGMIQEGAEEAASGSVVSASTFLCGSRYVGTWMQNFTLFVSSGASLCSLLE